jgi:circadian clock protein KaiC
VADVEKLLTGIPGFDHVSMGGLPRGRTTLVVGGPGSAKTVFSAQVLAGRAAAGDAGVFVSFEEPVADLRRNLRSLGWDIADWEDRGLLRFVDSSPVPSQSDTTAVGPELELVRAQVGQAVDQTMASTVVLDSLGSVFPGAADPAGVRRQLQQLVADLRRMGLTVIITAESDGGDAMPARFGVEEFFADSVVVLRNLREDEKRRRTVEVLKMRGAMHRKGEYPFIVQPGRGVVVIPLSEIALTQQSSNTRISSGNLQLDALCNGGFFRDSIVLASGATGTGKTLMVTEFMAGGVAAGDRCLLLAFEESRDQIFRNAEGWGRDFLSMQEQGLLHVEAIYPEVASLEDHLVAIKDLMDRVQPARVAVDSLSALERVGTAKAFREFIIGLTAFVKMRQVAALFTSTTSTLTGGGSVTEGHISTLTDSIILLRYVELGGAVRRALTVLKMRGSSHDRRIREFTIDASGMHIGEPFANVTGILAGRLVNIEPISEEFV